MLRHTMWCNQIGAIINSINEKRQTFIIDKKNTENESRTYMQFFFRIDVN